MGKVVGDRARERARVYLGQISSHYFRLLCDGVPARRVVCFPGSTCSTAYSSLLRRGFFSLSCHGVFDRACRHVRTGNSHLDRISVRHHVFLFSSYSRQLCAHFRGRVLAPVCTYNVATATVLAFSISLLLMFCHLACDVVSCCRHIPLP